MQTRTTRHRLGEGAVLTVRQNDGELAEYVVEYANDEKCLLHGPSAVVLLSWDQIDELFDTGKVEEVAE